MVLLDKLDFLLVKIRFESYFHESLHRFIDHFLAQIVEITSYYMSKTNTFNIIAEYLYYLVLIFTTNVFFQIVDRYIPVIKILL